MVQNKVKKQIHFKYRLSKMGMVCVGRFLGKRGFHSVSRSRSRVNAVAGAVVRATEQENLEAGGDRPLGKVRFWERPASVALGDARLSGWTQRLCIRRSSEATCCWPPVPWTDPFPGFCRDYRVTEERVRVTFY